MDSIKLQNFCGRTWKKPYFVTSEHFKIKIYLLFEDIMARYGAELSDLDNAHFYINPVYIIRQALFLGQQSLNEVLHHELIHHLDMFFLRKFLNQFQKPSQG